MNLNNIFENLDDNNHHDDSIKNGELAEYPANINNINRWTIPSISPSRIYNFGTFNFIARHAIKTIEQTVKVSNNTQTIRLLSKKELIPFKNYKYLHIGLVQIALKPLTLLGVNSSIMAYVRDGRNNNFQQSLAAVVETSLCHGPVYFEVSPDLSLSLSDSNLLDAMQLTIHTNGYNFKTGSEVMAICYRIHYKVLNTLKSNAKHLLFHGRTTLVQTNLLTTNIATNRLIKWNEIKFPETWSLPQEADPEPILNQDIDQILQTSAGDVEIKFNPQRITRLPGLPSLPRSMSARCYQPTDFFTANNISARNSTSTSREFPEEDLDKVDTIRISQNQIPEGIYPRNILEKGPTMSEMDFSIK